MPPSPQGHALGFPAAGYVLLLAGFWLLARHFSLDAQIGHMPSTFTAFALLFAPFWFLGFGAGETLRSLLLMPTLRVAAPALLVLPYLIYAWPRHEIQGVFVAVFLAIPVGSAVLLEFVPPATQKLSWQDAVILTVSGLPIELRWLRGSFPHSGLDSLSKLLLVDSLLYAYLVVRRLEGVGYDFRPRIRDGLIGLRELMLFAPIVISLGIALRFLRPHGGWPSSATAASDLMVTFFFVAIPEELFFRGLLQNLLEARVGHPGSLWLTAAIFGLSHFNKPQPFNWRYVLLATIAGVFYGRAWRDRRRLLASATTHTLVDVIWSLWFRAG